MRAIVTIAWTVTPWECQGMPLLLAIPTTVRIGTISIAAEAITIMTSISLKGLQRGMAILR
jgi:hypothetical protein